MKLKLILLSAVIALGVVTLAGCSEGEETPSTGGAVQNSAPSTSGTQADVVQNSQNAPVSSANSGYPDIWDVLPYIDETPAEYFEYKYTTEYGGGMMITGYLAESPKVRVPATLEGEPVVSVSLGKTVTELILPDTVQSFGISYKAIEYVNIPPDAQLYKFGVGAKFYGAKNLKAVYFDYGITTIPDHAFFECTSLTSIILPDSLTTIADNAFGRCYGLTSIAIPDSVTSIQGNPFEGCSKLTQITYQGTTYSSPQEFYNGINYTDALDIKDGVLVDCLSDVVDVVIPDGVTKIGERAFANCKDLVSVTIPDSVTSIGFEAFNNCSSLTSINIPYSVTSIENHAFGGCSSLTSVTIPSGIAKISPYTFSGCVSLTSITIPNSVTTIEDSAFSGCDNLTEIIYRGTQFNSPMELNYGANFEENGYMIIKDGVLVYCRPPEDVTDITIPSEVKEIDAYAFGERKIKSITIDYTQPGSVHPTGLGYALENFFCDYVYVLTGGNDDIGAGNVYEELIYRPWHLSGGEFTDSRFGYSALRMTIPDGKYGYMVPDGVTKIEAGDLDITHILDSYKQYPDNLYCDVDVFIPDSVTEIDIAAFQHYAINGNTPLIYCHSGSYAEQFARENGFPVEIID